MRVGFLRYQSFALPHFEEPLLSSAMSAAQILRALHALPLKEQWKIFARLGLKLRETSSKPARVSSKAGTKPAGGFAWNELHEWRQRTYGKLQRPNPVLAERDEAPFSRSCG